MSTPADTTSKPKTEKKPRNPDEPPKEKRPPREKKEEGKEGKPREPRPPRTENKGEFKKKDDTREGKPKESRPIFVKKTDVEAGGEGGEEKKTEKKHKEREKRESKFDWNSENIKIDTPIPEVPKKALLKAKPVYEEHLKQLDKVDDDIDEIHRQKKQYIDDLYNEKRKADTSAVSTQGPIRETLKSKIERKNELRRAFEDARKDTNKDKDEIERLFEESTKLRQKMKICKSLDELTVELAELKHTQSNAYLSLTEEKAIIKQIADVEKSLPFAEPLHQIETQMEALKKKSKDLKKVQNEAYEKFKKLEAEVNELQEDLDEQKKSRSDNKESLEPLIQQKKEEYQAKIDLLKKKKVDLKQKFRKDQDLYEDEQELIRYVDWVKRKVEKLKNHEKFLKREEERKLREVEDKKVEEAAVPNAFEKEIELCEQLIKYLDRIKPKNNKQEERQEEAPVDPAELQKKLESNEWKNAKVTLVVSKKDQDEFNGKRGKKNAKNTQTETATKKTEETNELKLQVDILRYFDELKVVAPTQDTDIEQTIAVLNQKKAYFESNPQQNEEGVEAPAATETKDEKPKQSKKNNQANITEEEFPSI